MVQFDKLKFVYIAGHYMICVGPMCFEEEEEYTHAFTQRSFFLLARSQSCARSFHVSLARIFPS